MAISFDAPRVVRGRTASLRDVVRQILHVAKVAGVDQVAIGSGCVAAHTILPCLGVLSG